MLSHPLHIWIDFNLFYRIVEMSPDGYSVFLTDFVPAFFNSGVDSHAFIYFSEGVEIPMVAAGSSTLQYMEPQESQNTGIRIGRSFFIALDSYVPSQMRARIDERPENR